jgi:hypothetical protein
MSARAASLARRPLAAQLRRGASSSTELPVNQVRSSFAKKIQETLLPLSLFAHPHFSQVARIARWHLPGESQAVAADKIVKHAVEELKKASPVGFAGLERTVCKEEWAYEVAIIFERPHFAAFMDSPLREETVLPMKEGIRALSVDGEEYVGNRVFDAFA